MHNTSETRLFLRHDEYISLVNTARVYDVAFYCTVSEWHCKYCGVLNEGNAFCIGCQAPKPENTKYGRLHIDVLLPVDAWVSRLDSGFSLYVVLGDKCCRPDIFYPERVMLEMTDCQIIQKRIPFLTCCFSDDVGPLGISLLIIGNIDLKDG